MDSGEVEGLCTALLEGSSRSKLDIGVVCEELLVPIDADRSTCKL